MPKPRRSKRHPLYPEPGAWVLNKTRGMVEMVPPKPLPRDRKLEAREVRDEQVAYEGLGYCIYELIPAQKIADERLAKLWTKARLAMQDIVEYLETMPDAVPRVRRPMRRIKRRRHG